MQANTSNTQSKVVATQSKVVAQNSTNNFQLSNPTLSRLMNEIKNEKMIGGSYDRTHNRHNRGGTS